MADLTVDTSGTDVNRGTDFQNKINAAALGDRILLTAGFTYQGNFTFPNKGAGTNYITVQLLDAQMSAIPAGTRVSRTQISSLATLATNTQSPVLRFDINSHHWKIIGCNITATAVPYTLGMSARLVADGNDIGAGANYGEWPKDIVIDRCVIHPYLSDPLSPFREFNKGVWIDGERITITECDVYDFGVWDMPNLAGIGISITAATAGSPCRVTLSSAVGLPSGYPAGAKMLVTFWNTSAAAPWNVLQGTKVATLVDSTHLDLENYDINLNLTPLNTTGFSAYPGAPGNYVMLAQQVGTSGAFLAVAGPGPYTIHNNFLESYYAPIFTGGGGGTWMPPGHVRSVSSVASLSQVTLDGAPTDLAVGDLIAFGDSQDVIITDAYTTPGDSSTTTLVMAAGSHQFPVGTQLYPEGYITVSGFTGTWTPCNGNFGGGDNSGTHTWCIVTSSTTLTIQVNSSGFGARTFSSPKWVAKVKDNFSGHTQWQVGKVTAIAGNTVTFDWWGHQPGNTGGNGAGIKVAVASPAQWKGRVIDGMTITNNTLSIRTFLMKLVWHNANLNNHVGQNPKAHWESKMADNVLLEGNILQQDQGTCAPFSDVVSIAVNQVNQNGATPWCTNNHWMVRNNWFKTNAYQKISLIEEYETGPESVDFTFTNNLIGRSQGEFVVLEGTKQVTITHNTVRNLGGDGSVGANAFMTVHHANDTVTIKDNIGNWCTYGWQVLDAPTNLTKTNNNYIDNFSLSPSAPSGDYAIRANDTAMGFTNAASADAGGDYHGYQLTSSSIGHAGNAGQASDGKDAGVDFALLDAALGGATGGGPTGDTNIRFVYRRP